MVFHVHSYYAGLDGGRRCLLDSPCKSKSPAALARLSGRSGQQPLCLSCCPCWALSIGSKASHSANPTKPVPEAAAAALRRLKRSRLKGRSSHSVRLAHSRRSGGGSSQCTHQ